MNKDLLLHVAPAPPAYPPDTRKRPRTLADAVDDYLSENYAKDETVRICATSLDTSDSLFGGRIDDKVILAHKIKVAGDKNGDRVIKDHTVHQIRTKLETALGRHNLNRKFRLRLAAKKRQEQQGAAQEERGEVQEDASGE